MEIKTMETKVKEKVMEMENINFIHLKRETQTAFLFLLLHQILTRC
jgi:hypothetical protein